MVGGITLRGVTVPVVDLRLALGQPADPSAPDACVIVMVDSGCILGLLADGVTGVFTAPPEAVTRMQHLAPADAAALLLAGTVRTRADLAPTLLLDPAALARLPQVPMVVDPEPQRQHSAAVAWAAASPDALTAAAGGRAAVAAAAPSAAALAATAAAAAAVSSAAAARPVVLMRCGRMPLAIDAMGVHATLSHTQVQPSALAMGHCRGVIDHAGGKLPLVDLLSLCGMGRTDLSGAFQAFIVRLETGLVAFAVDEVVDVVRVPDAAVVPVPRFAVPHPALFAGALPMAALSAEVVARARTPAQQFLMLDAQALKAHADVAGLAATGMPAVAGGTPAAGTADAPAGAAGLDAGLAAAGAALARRHMLTYALAGETATPIEQVAEILAYADEGAVFADGGTLLGMVMNRGRSIPVLCLSRLTGATPPPPGASVSVLVVHSAGEHIGFAVPQLRSIEPADWPLAADARGGAPHAGGPLDTRNLARVRSGGPDRLLPVLDLLALAQQVQGQSLRV